MLGCARRCSGVLGPACHSRGRREHAVRADEIDALAQALPCEAHRLIVITANELGVAADPVIKGRKGTARTQAQRVGTTTPHGRLLATMLAGIAEFERELIRARTGEGRTRAKARGVRFGRPPVLSVHQRQEVIHGLWRALRRLIWPEPMV
jgi:Resolvase, N terminal domain